MGRIVGNQIIGKVKTVTILKQPTENEFGSATFDFRDEYSVFDYGRMPDDIPFKGESLCRMSVCNFKELAKQGMNTHFVKSLGPKEFEVKTVRILYPQKGEVTSSSKNFLIPLEIIFRNSLPAGSSLLKRFKAGVVKPEDFGLKAIPKEGEKLEKPIITYTTKLEKDDRHLTRKEAQDLACLSDGEMAALEKMAFEVNAFLNKKAEKLGFEHADGKIEVAMTPERKLMLVDTFGTLDEDRFLYKGLHIGKQVIRDYYAKTAWGEEVFKKEAGLPYNLTKPEHLPAELLQTVSDMYKSVCEAWVGEKIWGAPKVEELIFKYKEFLKNM